MPLVALVVSRLSIMVCHDYSHKGHSLGSNETHGSLTKCHVSQKNLTIYVCTYVLFNLFFPIRYCHMLAF